MSSPPEQETVTLWRHGGAWNSGDPPYRRRPPFRLGGEVEVAEFVSLPRLEAAEAALRECVRLSGEDVSDGFPTWPPLHEFAVAAVRELREGYDECPTPEDLEAAEARARKATAALAELAQAVKPMLGTMNFYFGPGARTAVSYESKDAFLRIRDATNAALATIRGGSGVSQPSYDKYENPESGDKKSGETR